MKIPAALHHRHVGRSWTRRSSPVAGPPSTTIHAMAGR